mmetsp:Transcript_87389/g.154985  ORF Transcript_87389/g.154985 Transcript_87389/m.154985 type:complete len:101 (-) Transcript_87389:49-351(-)
MNFSNQQNRQMGCAARRTFCTNKIAVLVAMHRHRLIETSALVQATLLAASAFAWDALGLLPASLFATWKVHMRPERLICPAASSVACTPPVYIYWEARLP